LFEACEAFFDEGTLIGLKPSSSLNGIPNIQYISGSSSLVYDDKETYYCTKLTVGSDRPVPNVVAPEVIEARHENVFSVYLPTGYYVFSKGMLSKVVIRPKMEGEVDEIRNIRDRSYLSKNRSFILRRGYYVNVRGRVPWEQDDYNFICTEEAASNVLSYLGYPDVDDDVYYCVSDHGDEWDGCSSNSIEIEVVGNAHFDEEPEVTKVVDSVVDATDATDDRVDIDQLAYSVAGDDLLEIGEVFKPASDAIAKIMSDYEMISKVGLIGDLNAVLVDEELNILRLLMYKAIRLTKDYRSLNWQPIEDDDSDGDGW
jgi:hypothetical protein